MAVYMAQFGHDGPVKIGVSNQVSVRLRSIDSALWDRLKLLRLFEGGRNEERLLHQQFHRHVIAGEWYRYTEQMLGEIPLRELFGCAEVLPTYEGRKDAERVRSEALRAWMVVSNLDQFALAERLGCGASAVDRWLREGAHPAPRYRRKLLPMAERALGPQNGFLAVGEVGLDEGSVWLNW